jgi:hypothetical protein
VTLDTDFANPVVFDPVQYGGIAVLHLFPRSTPESLRQCIRTLIDGLERGSLEGKLWIVRPSRILEYPAHDGAQDETGGVG